MAATVPTTNGAVTRIACLFAIGGCTPHPGGFSTAAPIRGSDDTSFAGPQQVAIAGYGSDAMEPFITRDGAYLLFNDSNAPSADTDLFFATATDALDVQFGGPIAGADTPSLDAVASLDTRGELVFVSTRSYADTLSTLYWGSFGSGAVTGVALVPGVSRDEATVVNFDAEISADGSALYFVDGEIHPARRRRARRIS